MPAALVLGLQSRNVWQTWPSAAARRSGIGRSKSLGSATRSAASTRALRSGSKLPCRSPRPSRVVEQEHLALPLGRLGPGILCVGQLAPPVHQHRRARHVEPFEVHQHRRAVLHEAVQVLARHPGEDHVELPSADPTVQHRRDQLGQAVQLPGPARQARRLRRVQIGLGPQPRLQRPVPVDLVEPRSLVGAQGRQALHLHDSPSWQRSTIAARSSGTDRLLNGSGEWSQLHETEV